MLPEVAVLVVDPELTGLPDPSVTVNPDPDCSVPAGLTAPALASACFTLVKNPSMYV